MMFSAVVAMATVPAELSARVHADPTRALSDAFDDIAELAAACRFSDCSHETEPGCAVSAALADGRLEVARWQRYRALQRELAELAERLQRRERSRARRRRPDAGAS